MKDEISPATVMIPEGHVVLGAVYLFLMFMAF
jgi:hypothetical protein